MAVGFVAFLSFLAIHCLWFRLGSPVRKAKVVFRLSWLHLVTLSFYVVAAGHDLRSGALTLLTYAFLFLGYLEFYFTVDRSITTRMMILVQRSPTGGLAEEEMSKIFTPEKLIQSRLDDMVYGGYMSFDGTRYRNTAKGRIAARTYDIALRILKLND